MTWCLWWVLLRPTASSATGREPSAKLQVQFHPDCWSAAEPHDCERRATSIASVHSEECYEEIKCVILTPSIAHSGSAPELTCWMKHRCCFPESSWLSKHCFHCKTLNQGGKKGNWLIWNITQHFTECINFSKNKMFSFVINAILLKCEENSMRGVTCTDVAAAAVCPAKAVWPRQRRLHGGKHVVQAVADDDIVVNGHYKSHHNCCNSNSWREKPFNKRLLTWQK